MSVFEVKIHLFLRVKQASERQIMLSTHGFDIKIPKINSGKGTHLPHTAHSTPLRSNGFGRGGLGHLTAGHLPGGPVGLPARRAATSNVELGQMKSIVALIPLFKTSHQLSSSFAILLRRDQLTFSTYCYILITHP